MSSSRGTYRSSVERPLALRRRPDLIVEPQRYLGREYWVIKDPLTLKYYRFEEEEFALLEQLDGRASLRDLQETFENRFAPQRISFSELHRFLASLNRSCLVVSSAAGQGPVLLARGDQAAKKRRWGTLANLLSVRLRGFDPDRLLTWLERHIGWCFSRGAVLLGCVVMLTALLLVGVQFETFQAKLPEFQDFFAAKNWLWLAVTLAATKVLHEFGHGLACKRLGGECHEMGLMLLVFTPCLYCNVSDAWMLPNKWHRAAIAAAGMYVELLLSAICTWIWWFTHPGLLNYLCLNVVFVSSVSTIIFNANPLMRYDGYYILSDLLEIPNLRQKASAVMRRKLGSWFAGFPETPDPFLPSRHRAWFGLYAVASAVYRWIVVFSIFWFVYRLLEPYGLKIVGQLLACSALYSLLVAPLVQLVRFLKAPGRLRKMKAMRVAITGSVIVGLLLAVLLFPLPYRVECPLVVQPAGAEAMYVEIPGRIVAVHRQPGEQVTAGEDLVTLENDSLQTRYTQLLSKFRVEQQRARGARLQEAYAPDEDAQSARLEQAAASLRAQAAKHYENLQRLTIQAPRDGVWWPPAYLPSTSAEQTDELPQWNGYPTDAGNLGAYLEAGTSLGRVGDARQQEALLAVNQEVIESVRAGLRVDVVLPHVGLRKLQTTIVRVGTRELESLPKPLAGQFGGSIPSEQSEGGELRPQTPTYPVICEIPEHEAWLPQNAVGKARIHLGQRTVGWRLARWAMRTFNFEL